MDNLKEDAVFIGYQEAPGLKPLPLFNVVKQNSEYYQSTLSPLMLEKHNLKIPKFPLFHEWKNQ